MSYERVKFRKPVSKKSGSVMKVRTEYNRNENKRVVEEGLQEAEELFLIEKDDELYAMDD